MIVAHLSDDQLLEIAKTREFQNFLLEEDAKNIPPTTTNATPIKPRRESQDSSYFSDGSPCSFGNPATPQTTAKETLRATLNRDVKRDNWVHLSMIDDEKLFFIDEAGNR